MPSLDDVVIKAPPHSNFDYKTKSVKWNDLPQIKDGLIAPALIILEGPKVWIDEYAVHRALPTFMERVGAKEKKSIQIIVTNSGVLHIRSPHLTEVSRSDLAHIAHFLRQLDIEGEAWVKWEVNDDKWQRTPVDHFLARINPSHDS